MFAEGIVQRLRDQEVEVRLKCLQTFLEIGLSDPMFLSPETYIEICNRSFDKKVEIRKVLLNGIGKIYFKHVSSKLPLFETYLESMDHLIDPLIYNRLKLLPVTIIKFWGYPDIQTRHQVLRVSVVWLLFTVVDISLCFNVHDSCCRSTFYRSKSDVTSSRIIVIWLR